MNDKSKNVLIKLKSIQSGDSENSEVELVTEGLYRRVKNGFEISYKESEATGYKGSTTVISCLGNNYASMTRHGTVFSELIIEKNKKHHCYYTTPFGELSVGVFARKIDNRLSDKGGDLYFKYTIDVNSSYVSDNEVFLTVEEKNLPENTAGNKELAP